MLVKQLTESSWILTSEKTNKKIGMAIQQGDKISLMGSAKGSYQSLEEIAQEIGEKVTMITEESEENKIKEIKGYPIKHDQAFEITKQTITKNDLYSYKNKGGGKLVYAAGYYGIKFKNGYTSSFCPKLGTLEENDFIGPYRNEFDMKFHIGRVNKESGIIKDEE